MQQSFPLPLKRILVFNCAGHSWLQVMMVSTGEQCGPNRTGDAEIYVFGIVCQAPASSVRSESASCDIFTWTEGTFEHVDQKKEDPRMVRSCGLVTRGFRSCLESSPMIV